MESFTKAIGQKPEWVQPKVTQRHFELRVDEEVYAEVQFQSALGSLAIGNTSEGSWTFKRVGFFNPRVTVRRTGEETDYAVYRPTWLGTEGEITFADGRAYRWKAGNFWATQFAFYGADGRPLVTFKPGIEHSHLSDFFKYQARLDIEPEAAQIADLPLLAMLGWYLMILYQDDAAGAAAAATAA